MLSISCSSRSMSSPTCCRRSGDPLPAHDLGIDDRPTLAAPRARARRSRRRTRTPPPPAAPAARTAAARRAAPAISVFRAPEPLEQHLRRRRQDEDRHRLRERRARTAARPARRCPSRRARPVASTRSISRSQRAVQVAVHLGRLGELARAHARRGTPPGSGNNNHVPSYFARPRRPRRTGDGVAEVLAPASSSSRAMVVFPPPRRRADRMIGKRVHSRFSTCSRIRSSSSLIEQHVVQRSPASFALLPVVFASRSISWSRKPSRLPTPSAAASAQRRAKRRDVRRESGDLFGHVQPVGEDARSPARAAVSSSATPSGQLAAPPSRSRSRCSTTRAGRALGDAVAAPAR